MQAVLNGLTGAGLLIDGDRVSLLRADGTPATTPGRFSDLPHVLGEARNIEFVSVAGASEALEILRRNHLHEQSLDLALTLLDSDLSEACRKEAAAILNRMLLERDLRLWLEGVLYGAPLPASADLDGALRQAQEVAGKAVSALLLRLWDLQPIIWRVNEAWNSVCARVLPLPAARNEATVLAARNGVFRDLVHACEDDNCDQFMSVALSMLQPVTDHRRIVEELIRELHLLPAFRRPPKRPVAKVLEPPGWMDNALAAYGTGRLPRPLAAQPRPLGITSVVAIAGVVVALFGIYLGLSHTEPHGLFISPPAKPPSFAVTSPMSGASVGSSLPVQGTTPFAKGWNHYIVVTSPENVRWVQKGPLTRKFDGTLLGEAVIDQRPWDPHPRFTIAFLATKSRLIEGRLQVAPADAHYSSSVEVEASAQDTSLRVIEPAEGAQVTISELVHGTTPYAGRHHYIVVTPKETPNTRWIQDGVVTVRPDGTWSGNAQFGQGRDGGKSFLVRCLVTASALKSGVIDVDKIPSDAVFSPAVSVTRTR